MPNLCIATSAKFSTIRYIPERPDKSGLFLLCARQGASTWRCKPSARPTGGSFSRTARVPIARWDLKEAAGRDSQRQTLPPPAQGPPGPGSADWDDAEWFLSGHRRPFFMGLFDAIKRVPAAAHHPTGFGDALQVARKL
jgi:hypothetical protein